MGKFATDAVMLATVTGWAYLISYSYEWGYLSFFKLSPKLIIVDFASVLLSLIAIFSIVIFSAFISYAFLRKSASDGVFKIEIKRMAANLLIFVCIPYYLVGWDAKIFIFLMVFVAVSSKNIIDIFKIKERSFKKRLETLHQTLTGSELSILEWFYEKLKKSLVFKLIFILITVQFANLVGYSLATKQETWYLIEGNPELAIITMYGDRILAMPLDRVNLKLKTKLYVLTPESLSSLNRGINIESIGSLSL